jgi:hypothetical protein
MTPANEVITDSKGQLPCCDRAAVHNEESFGQSERVPELAFTARPEKKFMPQ